MSTESELDLQVREAHCACDEHMVIGKAPNNHTYDCNTVQDEVLALITHREQEAVALGRSTVAYLAADALTQSKDLSSAWDRFNADYEALTNPTPADNLTLSKSKGLKPAKDFDPSQVTLCPGCNQMTHTIMSDTKGNEDYCGKCGKVKPADNSDSGRPEKLGGPQTRDFAAEAKQVEKILNRPHEPDYQCTQCSKSPAEHTTAGAGDTPTKTEN